MLKFLHAFPEADFLMVAMESLLDDEEVLSAILRVTGQNGHKIRSDQWIALKFLHEFPEAVSLRVVMESQLDNEEVSSARLE